MCFLQKFEICIKGNSSSVWCNTLIDGNKIISGSDNNSIKIWDVENGSCLETFQFTAEI